MERFEACIPHDLEPTDVGRIALRAWIDATIAETDRGVFYWSNKIIEEGHVGDDNA